MFVFPSSAGFLVILKRECIQWLVKLISHPYPFLQCDCHSFSLNLEALVFVAELLQSPSLWSTAIFAIYGTSSIIRRINRNVPWLLSFLSSVQCSTNQQPCSSSSSSSSSSSTSSRFQLSIHNSSSSCSSSVAVSSLLASSAIQLSTASSANPLSPNLFGSFIIIFSFILFNFHLRFVSTTLDWFRFILGLLILDCFSMFCDVAAATTTATATKTVVITTATKNAEGEASNKDGHEAITSSIKIED